LRAAAIPYQSNDWTGHPDETTTFAHREDNFGEEQSCSCAEFYQDLRGHGGIVPIILTATGYEAYEFRNLVTPESSRLSPVFEM
jgi:hypothetical protein